MTAARYRLSFTVDLPAPTLPQAIERALRLFRPRVRKGLAEGATFVSRYKSRAVWLTVLEAPPRGRVSMKQRRRRLARVAGSAS